MNIREAFQEELRQMTQVAACARYRRGRQRRGCSLPSDALSVEQIRLRCGPVRVFRGGVEVTDAAEIGRNAVCTAAGPAAGPAAGQAVGQTEADRSARGEEAGA